MSEWTPDGLSAYALQHFSFEKASEVCRHAVAWQSDRDELERERIKLAACGVIALCNTQETLQKQKSDIRPEYISSSLDSVIEAVEREIGIREELAAANARIARLKALLDKENVLDYFGPNRKVQQLEAHIVELGAAITTFRDNPITKNQFAMYEVLDK